MAAHMSHAVWLSVSLYLLRIYLCVSDVMNDKVARERVLLCERV